jgi:hypothetical protein
LRVYHVPGPTQSLFLSLSLFWIPWGEELSSTIAVFHDASALPRA